MVDTEIEITDLVLVLTGEINMEVGKVDPVVTEEMIGVIIAVRRITDREIGEITTEVNTVKLFDMVRN